MNAMAAPASLTTEGLEKEREPPPCFSTSLSLSDQQLVSFPLSGLEPIVCFPAQVPAESISPRWVKNSVLVTTNNQLKLWLCCFLSWSLSASVSLTAGWLLPHFCIRSQAQLSACDLVLLFSVSDRRDVCLLHPPAVSFQTKPTHFFLSSS